MLDVVTSTHMYRPYLLGNRFLLRTDHNFLLQNFKESEGQLARWPKKLQHFDNAIICKQHSNADAMFRMVCSKCRCPIHSKGTDMAPAINVVNLCKEPIVKTRDIRTSQLSDPCIKPRRQGFYGKTSAKPSPDIIKGLNNEARSLFQQNVQEIM